MILKKVETMNDNEMSRKNRVITAIINARIFDGERVVNDHIVVIDAATSILSVA